MRLRSWFPVTLLATALLLGACRKKATPPPVDPQPKAVAKVEPKPVEPTAVPIEEDMPDEEEPSMPDTDPAAVPAHAAEPTEPAAEPAPAPAPAKPKVTPKAQKPKAR